MVQAGRALAWRLRRHGLEPAAGAETAADVGRRVLAIRGWPLDAAGLSVSVRQATPTPGDLERALGAGEMVRSYAFRGGSYAFTPDIAALVLSVRTATRVWETRRWQQQGGFALEDWEPLREAVCDALADGPMTRGELSARLARTPLAHLSVAATGTGADSLYKPLHWWGDICFGPQRDGHSTFRLLRDDRAWRGLPDVDDAGRALVTRYLGSYGPATRTNLHYWFTEGLGAPRRRLDGWLRDVADHVTVDGGDGDRKYVLSADLEALQAAEPSETVRLLPPFDPWILGPGTADLRLVAPARRAAFSQGSSPVIVGGVVAGIWRLRAGTVEVACFREAGALPAGGLDAEVQRLAAIRAEELSISFSTT